VAWPRRHLYHPVNDVTEYRKDTPPNTTVQEVGEAASEYFQWSKNPVLTSADYVTTVVNSFDNGRRTVFDELSIYTEEERT